MVSRYFNHFDLTPVAVVVSLVISFSAQGSTLPVTDGEPLSDDFSALMQLLNDTDAEQQRQLGLNNKPVSGVSKSADKTSTLKKPDDTPEPEAAPKKNPAFYNVDLARKLYDALDVGDAQRVKWMLQSGAGNVYVSDSGDTSLRLAVRKGWASVVRVLLEREPDLEQKQPGKVNLLHEASVKGAYDIAKMLIAAGLDPEVKTEKNWSNLHLAARYGRVEMVRYYLGLGLDPDARNSEGNTAYWLANHARHYQAAGYLSSRTNASSYEMFNGKKSKKKRKSTRKGRKATPSFTPAQLKAIMGS